jgi:glycogen synthase
MTDFKRNPRVLIVTPEVAYLPHGMDNVADYLTAKASGLADVSAALINALFEQGADVYVVLHLDVKNNTGNGFIFEVYNSQGQFWAIRQAMKFYKLPAQVRQQIVERIMTQSAERFNHVVTARRYIELYENMLQRPLINSGCGT